VRSVNIRTRTRCVKPPSKFNDYELYSTYCFSAQDPSSYVEAIQMDPDWEEAIQKEIDAHQKHPWKPTSRKQPTVALSTAEAEYVACADTMLDLLHAKELIEEMCGEVKSEVKLKCDNQSAINLIESYENSKRAKHIDIKLHYIKDIVASGKINLDYVRSEDNLADIFTKPLPRPLFEKFRKLLNIH